MIRDALGFALVSFSAVFVVVDPLGAVPFFLALTSDLTEQRRREVVRRAAVACAGVLTLFALGGGFLFQWLGVSLAALKLAGGVLLLLVAIDMLRTRPSAARVTPREIEAGSSQEDVAIVPLAMPLLAGPGSIATVMVLMGRAQGVAAHRLAVVLAVLLTAAAVYFILSQGSRVERILGPTGMRVVERLAGLLLAAIAVQFLIDGLLEAFPALRH